jgi:hypothetical protein
VRTERCIANDPFGGFHADEELSHPKYFQRKEAKGRKESQRDEFERLSLQELMDDVIVRTSLRVFAVLLFLCVETFLLLRGENRSV